MYVKRLSSDEIKAALHLAWEVFEVDVAPTYPAEGVQEFQKFISEEHMMPKVQSRAINFFGAVEGDVLCGISAIRQDGHIALLFVKKEWQRRGAARMLFYAMQQYCVIERMEVQMTVSATPNAVEAYKHLGFHPTNNEQIVDGIRFVPMAYVIKDAGKIVTGGGRTRNKTSGIILIFLMMTILGMSILGGKHLLDMMEDYTTKDPYDQSQNVEEFSGADGSQNEWEDTQEETGIASIQSYHEDNLPYTIKEEVYTLYSDGTDGKYRMAFEVHYPQLEGVESKQLAEINQKLKECAMSTVEVLYLNPSQDTKEAMLKQENPVLASMVTYNVTYATEDFISVVFNDYYFAGSEANSYVDLRTRNMSLKDGMEYQIKDIITLSDDFMRQWKTRMKNEAPQVSVIQDMRTSDLYQILNGKVLGGNYYNAFFVDAEGIEIGMTYHHTTDEGESAGWITAPFTFAEIKEFASESEFWKMIKQ